MERYLNFLRSLGRPGQLPPATKSVRECIQEAFPEALKWYAGHWNSKEVDTQEVALRFQKALYKTIFNTRGGITRDSRGLIYIERALRMSKDKLNNLETDYYSVGECWAYVKGSAKAYCAGSGNLEIKLKGWVDPSDINWVETLYISTYSMASEKEIRLSDEANTVVEIFDVLANGKSILDEPLICRATADKYSHRPDISNSLRQSLGTKASYTHSARRDSDYDRYLKWKERLKSTDDDLINYPPHCGYRLVKKGSDFSLRNKQGELVTDQWWDGISFIEDVLRVRKNGHPYLKTSTKAGEERITTVGKYNLVSPKGRELLSSWVDEITASKEAGNETEVNIRLGTKVWIVTIDQIKHGIDLSSLKPTKDSNVDWDDRNQLKEEEI